MDQAITAFRGEYSFLSNMFAVPVEWDGRTYRNSEAAFQSAKTLNAEERDAFCGLTGAEAKKRGRKVLLRGDWEEVKDGIMEEVVRAKFTQNPALAKKLAETGGAQLMEGNTWHDTYWGVDSKTLEGGNHLGIILMKIRAELSRGSYLVTVKKVKSGKKEAERKAAEALEKERGEILAGLDRIPEHDLIGMEVGTKAFGRGRIVRREGNYLTVSVGDREKKFVLPGCFIQGFLIPDDPDIVENCRRRQHLSERLKTIESQTAAMESTRDSGQEKALELKKYEPDMAAEQRWLKKEPNKSLAGTVVLVPAGTGLSRNAIETIRHVRFYVEARDGFVLFSDRVFAFADDGSPDDMVERAQKEVNAVMSAMPDFEPLDMDDGCGLLHMSNAKVYAFRPYGFAGSFAKAVKARSECLEACEKGEIAAIVYSNAEAALKYLP